MSSRPTVAAFAAALLFVAASASGAQTAAAPDPPQKQAAPEKPTKQPPAPLFPRHRRGIYKNNLGINLVDATPQSPPLATDDPGVPDKGEWEINFSTGSDRTTGENRLDVLRVDLNYGMLPTIGGHKLPAQLKLEFPIAGIRTEGEPSEFGPGAVAAGLKLNFYSNEHAGFSFSLYPQIEFAPPFGNSVEKGLAEPGQELILPILVEKEFHALIIVANAGIEKPVNVPAGSDAANASGTYSLAIGRALTRRLAAMVEWRGESVFTEGGEHLSAINFGFIRGVRNIILYGNAGRSVFTGGGPAHAYLGFGIKLLVEPKHHDAAQR